MTSTNGGSVIAMPRRMRCAVYTRKSSEEGLDMEFNSLDAQREACEAYIASQRAEGWVTVRDQYDDGGFSGGTLERPALQRLLADIAGWVDRRHRCLQDRPAQPRADGFFQAGRNIRPAQCHLRVSVTQSFNTTTSMGRLTLNILLSFAQFEREVIGERIRDKFAASRKKGMWMGGLDEAEVREALDRLDPLWDELFPAEQARIVQLLVERVDVSPDGADIRLRTEGLTNLVADLRTVNQKSRRAA